MRDVSTKQAALTVIAVTVVLATVFYPATFFARRSSLNAAVPLSVYDRAGHLHHCGECSTAIASPGITSRSDTDYLPTRLIDRCPVTKDHTS